MRQKLVDGDVPLVLGDALEDATERAVQGELLLLTEMEDRHGGDLLARGCQFKQRRRGVRPLPVVGEAVAPGQEDLAIPRHQNAPPEVRSHRGRHRLIELLAEVPRHDRGSPAPGQER